MRNVPLKTGGTQSQVCSIIYGIYISYLTGGEYICEYMLTCFQVGVNICTHPWFDLNIYLMARLKFWYVCNSYTTSMSALPDIYARA